MQQNNRLRAPLSGYFNGIALSRPLANRPIGTSFIFNQGTPHEFLSHTTDESYREGTETLPYKIERSGTGAGVPAHHYSLFTILYSLRESFFHANRSIAFLIISFYCKPSPAVLQ